MAKLKNDTTIGGSKALNNYDSLNLESLNSGFESNLIDIFNLKNEEIDTLIAMDNNVVAGPLEKIQEYTLQNNNTGTLDHFGEYSIDTNSKYILVGSPGWQDARGDDVGRAYLYNKITGDMVYIFEDLSGATGDKYGYSVSITEDLIAISAPYSDFSSTNGGLIYIYDVHTFSYIKSFGSGNAERHYGYSLKLEGKTLIIGSDTSDGYCTMYKDVIGSVSFLNINNPGITTGSYFGQSLTSSSNYLAVGAPWSDDSVSDGGSVYIYDFNGNHISTVSGSSTFGHFGESISIKNGKLLVGSYNYNNDGTGRAYLYNVLDGSLIHIFENPEGATANSFGWDVELTNEKVIISGTGFSDTRTNVGKVYVYDINDFSLISEIVAPLDYDDLANFGKTIKSDNNRIFVGSYNYNASTLGKVMSFNIKNENYTQLDRLLDLT